MRGRGRFGVSGLGFRVSGPVLSPRRIGFRGLLIPIFAHLLFFSSCSLDHDDGFYPVTKEQFLLVGEENRQLLHVQQAEVDADWLSQFGWTDAVSDMDALVEDIWFVSESRSELLHWHAASKSHELYPLENFSPASLLLGTEYILLIDSLHGQMGFWNLESRSLQQRMDWDGGIGESIYRGGKFFVQKGKRSIQVFQENSLQLSGEIELSQDIFNIQMNASHVLFVMSRDSLIYQQYFSYYSYSPVSEQLIVNYDQLIHTPYYKSNYGKEWLRNILVVDNSLQGRAPFRVISENVQSYAIDFFEGKILVQRNDSLFSQDLRSGDAVFLSPLGYPIQKYQALRLAQGE